MEFDTKIGQKWIDDLDHQSKRRRREASPLGLRGQKVSANINRYDYLSLLAINLVFGLVGDDVRDNSESNKRFYVKLDITDSRYNGYHLVWRFFMEQIQH